MKKVVVKSRIKEVVVNDSVVIERKIYVTQPEVVRHIKKLERMVEALKETIIIMSSKKLKKEKNNKKKKIEQKKRVYR